ncbi:hypothetical protein [Asaia lannensis]|uniref:hypothetical protein n=1 Tax=Asaia lannensis TaxID=415421 RepID=UPI0038736E09
MGVSQVHAVARIERDLARHTLHEAVYPTVARGFILGLVSVCVDLERIVDRHRLLDRLHPVEFRLLTALGFGRIVIGSRCRLAGLGDLRA